MPHPVAGESLSEPPYLSSVMLTLFRIGLTVKRNIFVIPLVGVEPPERALPPIVRVPAFSFGEPCVSS